jgi:hypothetical protein
MPYHKTSLKTMFGAMDQTCLVMIDRSMWFGQTFQALNDDEFQILLRRYPDLRNGDKGFREPLRYAFSYAQRVFLCSAIETCLVYHYANSAALFIQRCPDQISRLTNLLQFLKKHKRYGVKTLDDWIGLDWDLRLTHLRELQFSRLSVASRFFDDIYGVGWFDSVWGADAHATISARYSDYQDLRNGILHRGGETNSGNHISADGRGFESVFNDALAFRDAILTLSRRCYDWWRNDGPSTGH